MNKKILSVGQQIRYDRTVNGIIFLLGGLFFSCKGMENHVILMSFFTVILCGYIAFLIIRKKRYEEEKFDEMAIENLNRASRKVLLDVHLICLVIIIVDIIQDRLKHAFSIIIPWKEYFTINPMSFVMLILGFQSLMTGIHFKRLERE